MSASWLWHAATRSRGASRELPSHFDRLHVLRSVEATLAVESERMHGVETGGVLVGFIDSRLNVLVITAASGPGPKAHHGPHTFNRDREFCQAFLDERAAATCGVIDFVGEWHKHPEPDPTPSSVDRNTYTRLVANPACHLDRIALLIAGTELRGRWPSRKDRYTTVNAWSVRADGLSARDIEWLPSEAYWDLVAPEPRSSGECQPSGVPHW